MHKFLISVVTVLLPAAVLAATLDKIQFLKISGQDSKAVIKGVDGKMAVIKPGDMVAENIVVKEIAPGRIVLEEKTESGLDTIIVRMSNGKTRVEHHRKRPDNPQLLVAPAMPKQ